MIYDSDSDEVWLSPWLRSEFPDIFAGLTATLEKYRVTCGTIPLTRDLWCRDYMPIQIDDGRFVCYSYRPDYLTKSSSDRRFITDSREVCRRLRLDAKYSDIVIDGGNVVKAGSRIIMTEKVFAENPGYERSSLVRELERLFECELLFLPWDRAEKYGHSDGIVKAVSDDTVLMTNYADFDADMAREIKRCLSASFHVEELRYDCRKKDSRSWAYINFLTVGNLIVLPLLGSEYDEPAFAQIETCYPNCTIVQLDVSRAIAAGGGLNCITWCRKGNGTAPAADT